MTNESNRDGERVLDPEKRGRRAVEVRGKEGQTDASSTRSNSEEGLCLGDRHPPVFPSGFSHLSEYSGHTRLFTGTDSS